MAISPDPEIPDVLYIDENAIDDVMSYIEPGTVEQIVSRVRTESESEREVGLDKILVGRLGSTSVEGEETEVVRSLDPIGKLAMMIKLLDEEGLLLEMGDLPADSSREELRAGRVVQAEVELIKTPLEEIIGTIDKALDAADVFGSMMDVDEEEVDEVEEVQEMMTGIQREGDLLRARSEAPFDFVLQYDNEKFSNPGFGFPVPGTEYTVIGQVSMKVDEDQSIALIDFVDLATRLADNPRESHRKARELRSRLAEAASTIAGRDVDVDEFEISHPDVQMKPLAIYR